MNDRNPIIGQIWARNSKYDSTDVSHLPKYCTVSNKRTRGSIILNYICYFSNRVRQIYTYLTRERVGYS